MTTTQEITIYESPSTDWAIVYVDGARHYTGHVEEAYEAALEAAGINLEQVPHGFFQTRRGDEPELDTIAGADQRIADVLAAASAT